MQIRLTAPWQLPESAATPEADYRLHRRDFLKAAGSAAFLSALTGPRGWAATEGLPGPANPKYSGAGLKPTSFESITSYNNFFEFGTDKSDPKNYANKGWKPEPWTVEIGGLVKAPLKIDVEELVKKMGGVEQRVYRHRCVEAWSMVIPWNGFPLAKLVALADPKPEAKFVKFTSFLDPKAAIGQTQDSIPWPYVEGLRLDEATNELAFIATGIYGKPLPNQNGAPLRLVTPWKYGFKGIKSIVKIELVSSQPRNSWQVISSSEYGFYANVNPNVDHPRWSQASERVIGAGVFGGRQKTLMFNGYDQQVAGLYKGLDLTRNF